MAIGSPVYSQSIYVGPGAVEVKADASIPRVVVVLPGFDVEVWLWNRWLNELLLNRKHSQKVRCVSDVICEELSPIRLAQAPFQEINQASDLACCKKR